MKTQSNRIGTRGVLITVSALLTATFAGLLLTKSPAQAAQSQISDRSSFLSETAVMSSSPGSPINKHQKIIVCYKGKETKRIEYKEFLKHPDKYTAGPCPAWTLVCENNHDQKWIKTSKLAKWLEDHKKNGVVGNCTGVRHDDERVICWKGWTIIAKVKDLSRYPGYTNGPCP